MDRGGGRVVSEAVMVKLMRFFSELIFWNQLPCTTFEWVENFKGGRVHGSTDGELITMDPEREDGNALLSTLVSKFRRRHWVMS